MRNSTFLKSLLVMALVLIGSKSFAADNYVQITSMTDLTDGSYVIVGATSSNAMNTVVAGTNKYLSPIAVTIDGDKIVDPAADLVWTITKNSAGNYLISANGKYVSSNGSGNNAKLIDAPARTAEFAGSLGDNGTFKFTCLDLYGSDKAYRLLQYNANSGQERFACYTGTQKDLLLYKLTAVEEGTTATPSISPLTGTYYTEQEVSMDCETPGAKIYYTTDGSEPTAASILFSAPFKVSTTTTVKAVAIATGLKISNVKEITLTFPVATEVANIAAYMSTAAAGDAIYKITGPVTVVYQNGLNLYVQDASGSLLVYGDNGISEYKNGDIITGLIGKYGAYQNVVQLIPESAPEATTGTAVEPTTKAIADITTADAYKFIKLSEAVFKTDATFSTSSTTNGIISDGNIEMTVRNNFRVISGTFAASKKWDIEGFVSVYNNGVQFYPISIVEAQLDGTKVATTDDNIAIYSSNGKIYINAVGGEKIELFNTVGQKIGEKVAVAGLNTLDAANDIIIVKVGSKVVKVIK